MWRWGSLALPGGQSAVRVEWADTGVLEQRTKLRGGEREMSGGAKVPRVG